MVVGISLRINPKTSPMLQFFIKNVCFSVKLFRLNFVFYSNDSSLDHIGRTPDDPLIRVWGVEASRKF